MPWSPPLYTGYDGGLHPSAHQTRHLSGRKGLCGSNIGSVATAVDNLENAFIATTKANIGFWSYPSVLRPWQRCACWFPCRPWFILRYDPWHGSFYKVPEPRDLHRLSASTEGAHLPARFESEKGPVFALLRDPGHRLSSSKDDGCRPPAHLPCQGSWSLKTEGPWSTAIRLRPWPCCQPIRQCYKRNALGRNGHIVGSPSLTDLDPRPYHGRVGRKHNQGHG